mgnify:CR=1 FL=1
MCGCVVCGLLCQTPAGTLRTALPEPPWQNSVSELPETISRRKTVTSMDVVYALKRQGRTLYGFGG